MNQKKGEQFSKKSEKKLDLNKRITEMIDASGNYSQTYPYYMYRKGKYVTEQQEKIRSTQQYISRTLYDKCFEELSANKNLPQNDVIVDCYKHKVAIFRQIIQASRYAK